MSFFIQIQEKITFLKQLLTKNSEGFQDEKIVYDDEEFFDPANDDDGEPPQFYDIPYDDPNQPGMEPLINHPEKDFVDYPEGDDIPFDKKEYPNSFYES